MGRASKYPEISAGLRKALEKIVGKMDKGDDLMRRAERILRKRKVLFPLMAGAESVALRPQAGLIGQLAKWATLLPNVETLRNALRVATHLSTLKRTDITGALDRMPTDFFPVWVDQLKTAYAAARNAKQRATAIQHAVDELNEILGLFHPEVIARYVERASALATELRSRPAFNKRFEILSNTPEILRCVKAPGVKGSKVATRLSVDGMPVLRVADRETKEVYYVMLGDIQVKSSNVRELVFGEGGRPGQLLRDNLRTRRGLDISIFSPEGMTIRRERLIDPTTYGVSRADVSATVVGQRKFTDAERNALLRRRIEAEDFKHDVSTSTSRELTMETIKLLFPAVAAKKSRVR